ncbi:MAG: hypothetical protein JWL81_2926 [Verrucomicrobiales bacterium]|nr:hypothetical protein [Verrucomicrobiales bacterium]
MTTPTLTTPCPAASAASPIARYTRDGSDALENRIRETCEELGRAVRAIVPADQLRALVLAGGYGRGEGGVLSTADGDAPYNDLEFFLLIEGSPRLNEKRYGAAIHALEQRMTPVIGIDVEFKITSLEKLRSGATTMFSYDLVSGHRVVTGPADILENCAHHLDARRIPAHEATRLLMNRCSGLLFAAGRLAKSDFSQEDADFTARNIAKAQLALGDVVLAALGRYHWSCLTRHERLLEISEPALPMADILEFHSTGVTFKLHPAPHGASRELLAALHRRVCATAWKVWSWLEEKRLGRSFPTPESYAFDPLTKCPETHAVKNALLRLRTFGPAACYAGSRFRYPRETLFNTLSVLLWDPASASGRFLSQQFLEPIPDAASAMPAYARLWARYN